MRHWKDQSNVSMTYYAGRGVLVFLDEWSFDMEEKTTYMTINEETAEEIENKMPEESVTANAVRICLKFLVIRPE